MRDKNLLQLKEKNIKLLSCDIFDTLMLRTTIHPEDVFFHVAEEALRRKVLNPAVSAEEFKLIRMAADREARRVLQTEVNFIEIYNQIPEHYGDKARLMEIELEVEKKCLFLNPSVASFLQYCHSNGISIILLSDMYYSAAQLEELLKHVGFNCEIVKEIIVSSEHRLTKWNQGMLFTVLLKKYPYIDKKAIVHIGDNYKTDVLNCKKFGIDAIHYYGKEDRNSSFELERQRLNELIPELFSLRKLAWNMSGAFSKEERFWFEFGAAILGPIEIVSIEWVIDSALKERIRNIYPLMRGGEFHTNLINRSLEHRGIKGIKVKPLYVSRRSTFLPSIKEINKDTLQSLLNVSWMTVEALFRRLKISNIFEDYSDVTLGQSEKTNFGNGKTLKQVITNYLLSPDLMERLKRIQESESDLLLKYLIGNFDLNEPYITYDIGHAGTIQFSLDQHLRGKGYPKGIHLMTMANEMTLDRILKGSQLRGLLCNAGINGKIYRSKNWMPGIIDELITENVGSTIGYKKEHSSKVVPILEQNVHTNNQKAKELCQQGIVFFQSLFLNLQKEKPWILERILNQKEKLIWILSRFMEYPTYQEAVELGNLEHENLFDEGHSYGIFCPSHLENQVRTEGITSFVQKRRTSLLVWPAGVVERAFPHYSKISLFKQGDAKNSRAFMANLALKLLEDGECEIMIYGAGQMGDELADILNGTIIKVKCFIDKNESLWGSNKNGIPVLSLDDALKLKVRTVAVASFAYTSEIIRDLKNLSQKMKLDLKIVAV
ncbi:hypothetical protein [Cohnella algarum]|uniref:hypothetical protein n=1 Tax=Cohnella algarum TaxID=2044859 RepID=UPI001968201F|nr:hypothetical protein [Cohnella algarum]MBN2980617.1 hypothetical protein [Cohnella algarum]